jgi:glycerophosphoryl diester phosphodiesterase
MSDPVLRRNGILCCMPSGFLDSPRPLAFAHRGGAAHRPENSWSAFTHAIGLGYRYLETDVQATTDGVLVAFHDRTLDRVTGTAGRIAQMPYRDVSKARIGGAEPIPVLEELLTAWPEARFNIDVKDFPAIRPLAEVLVRTGAWERACIASFSPRRLRVFREVLDRGICTSLSPLGIAAVRAGVDGTRLAARFAASGAACAQVPVRVATPRFLRHAHALGLQVHVWTVNDPAMMRRLLDAGVDGIMTDDTVALRDVLIERSQWPAGTGPASTGPASTGLAGNSAASDTAASTGSPADEPAGDGPVGG